MTTQQKIDALIEEQFWGYRSVLFEGIKYLHDELRSEVGDEIFLLILEEWKKKYPRTICLIPEYLKTQLQ